MDYTIRWSPEATEDLELISEYISRDSKYYAQSVVSKILDTSHTIKEQTFIGREVPELCINEIRECIICLETKLNIPIDNCMHFVCCNCYIELNKCPFFI